jgi:hypothetical protein
VSQFINGSEYGNYAHQWQSVLHRVDESVEIASMTVGVELHINDSSVEIYTSMTMSVEFYRAVSVELHQ